MAGRAVAQRPIPELHGIDGPLGQRAALQNPVLRLPELVVVVAASGIEHRIELGHLRGVRFDQHLHASFVDRGLPQGVQRADDEDDEEHWENDPAAFVKEANIVHQVMIVRTVRGRRHHRTVRLLCVLHIGERPRKTSRER